jgi:hypothetical protein
MSGVSFMHPLVFANPRAICWSYPTSACHVVVLGAIPPQSIILFRFLFKLNQGGYPHLNDRNESADEDEADISVTKMENGDSDR